MSTDGARHGEHVAEVRRAILIRRRTDRDHDGLAMRYTARGIGRKTKTARSAITCNQRVEPRLVDRHLAAAQQIDALGDDVAADDAVAELGEAGGGDEADVADADDADRLASAQRGTVLKLFAIAIIAEFGMRPVSEFSSQ